jgi:hypothetical protein
MLLAGIVVSTGGLRLAFGPWYAKQYQRVSGEAWARAARAMQAGWRRFHYTPVAEPGFTERFITRIDWNAVRLPDPQMSKLRTKLGDLMRYLENPTFEGYYRLRSEGLSFAFRPTAPALSAWTNSTRSVTTPLPSDAAEVARVTWNSVHTYGGQLKPPRLAAVCLDNVAATIAHTNSGWTLLGGRVAKGQTGALEAPNPGFEYGPTKVLARNGAIQEETFFHLSFFARLEGSESTGPVYVSLAWLPADDSWAPSRLIADEWLQLKTIF